MKFTRELPGTLTVRSVSSAGIRVNDEVWTENIALTAQEVIAGWTEKPVAELTADDFAEVLSKDPEIVLLGTGKTGELPTRELMFAFARRGVGLEFMDTQAAARTFNVLAGEGRRVLAVLIQE
ncbi:MAG: hypothetical protein K0U72_00145 [Gammaproteobacteria bacterium]|nr:hypothetical protein [Gammaproteobacteria bacterium]